MRQRLSLSLSLCILLVSPAVVSVASFAQDSIDTSSAGANCTGIASGTGSCVTTYHNDVARDGVNPNEILLTPGSFTTPVGSSNFGSLGTASVDGLVYAQPLYLTGVNTTGSAGCSTATSSNLVLVATENNTVYAYSVSNAILGSFTMTLCWQTPLNAPGENAVSFTNLAQTQGQPCNNVVPQSGITGTPVIDASVKPPIMYVVSAHQIPGVGGAFTYAYRLHALKMSTGAEVGTAYDLGMNITPTYPNFSVQRQNQRPGLAMFRPTSGTQQANLYVAFGSFCDANPYSGYVIGAKFTYSTRTFSSVTGTASTSVIDMEADSVDSNHDGGGIWMSGGAPAVDGSGNIYVSVGNGEWNGSSTVPPYRSTQFGHSVVKIANTGSALQVVDYYTPNDWDYLNVGGQTVCADYGPTACPVNKSLTLPGLSAGGGDLDVGSGGVTMITPTGVTTPVCASPEGEIVATGKEGVTYGVCYDKSSTASGQTVMGGLDGCGYKCDPYTTLNSIAGVTACSLSTPLGKIGDCFPGVDVIGAGSIGAEPGLRGTATFWAVPGSIPALNYLYTGGSGNALTAYLMDTSSGRFSETELIAMQPNMFAYPGTIPSLTWNSLTSGTGVLWAVDVGDKYGSWNGTTQTATAAKAAVLYVYAAKPVSGVINYLWDSTFDPNISTYPAPGAVKFTVPTVANGLVFIAGGGTAYAPGIVGKTHVTCTAAALAISGTPACTGMLTVYGKLHP